MSKPGLDHRHRNKDGQISGKHGNTLVRTLRKVYGQGFAAGYAETAKLSEVMREEISGVGSIPWTSEEDKRLRALALSGISVAAMATQKRSTAAVRNRAARLKIVVAKSK